MSSGILYAYNSHIQYASKQDKTLSPPKRDFSGVQRHGSPIGYDSPISLFDTESHTEEFTKRALRTRDAGLSADVGNI